MAIYMNFNSNTPAGNVTAKGYENWIEVDSFSFGVGRGISMEAGAVANREATRPSLSEVTVTKRIDAASGGLFKSSVTGDEGVKVEIHVVQTGANSVEKFAVYTLEDVLISSYSISASAGGAPAESISLSFAKIEADLAHADKTNKNPKNMRVGYDLTTASPL
ncbi:Hcp family type VI secretion system effector [Microbulbifer hydrolyticus]|uniref:Hcp1 family type VI secretion system effector n=1 Tax=Microbulbifer hydrolyticus TaxID=48074 RepID=A0A6P1T547_9GAMM|nr:type VI secretion system tube protein Hcp [Microbulbifer hydrolyticus]MBB5211387.1 type VI secretion system secreted protein Hcp [Microbulbifer hydrolyticus]QHQ37858.1 Hcp1 family type VI secretion system effector [Microbulbifer hydrolyticus]